MSIATTADTQTLEAGVTAATIPFGGLFSVGEYIVSELLNAIGVPSPLQAILGAFAGRPTMAATIQLANTLLTRQSPALKMLAMGAAKLVHDGIPISSPEADPIFGPYFKGANIIENAIRWQNQHPDISSLDALTLKQALSEAGGSEGSSTATLDSIDHAWKNYQQLDPQHKALAAVAAMQAGDPGTDLARGFAHQWLKQNPAQKPQAKQPPYTPPGSFPFPVQPIEGDEINDLQENLNSGIQAILSAQSNPSDCTCAKEVVASIAALNVTISKMPMQAMHDDLHAALHNIREGIDAIDKTLQEFAPGGKHDHAAPVFPDYKAELECICEAIRSLARTEPAVDVKQIVDALKKLSDDNQAPETWTKALIDTGALPPQFAQLIQGTTWLQVLATAAHEIGAAFGWTMRETVEAGGWLAMHVAGPVARVMFEVAQTFVVNFDAGAGIKPGTIAKVAQTLAAWVQSGLETILGGAVSEMIRAYESDLKAVDTSTIEGANQAAEKLLARSLEFGVVAHCIAYLAELPLFNKLYGFKELAALVSEFSGFKEVIIQTHRPFLTAAVGRPATYATNREYLTALPPTATVDTWFARRKLSESDMLHVRRSYGYPSSWDGPMNAAAYKPISMFTLRTLYQDRPVDKAALRQVLEDSALSPADVNIMLDAFEYFSTQTVRNAYVNQLHAAYAAGVVGQEEMHAALDALGWSAEAKKYILDRAALEQRVNLARKVEAQVVPLVAAGQITGAEAIQQLEAAGVQPWYYNVEIALANTKAALHAAKLEAAAERKAELETQRDLTRAAVAQYQRGEIDLKQLGVALAGVGIDPALVAAILSVQQATAVGRQKVAYGVLLPAEQARVLSERVAAIEQQTKDQFLTLDQAEQMLHTLKIPPAEINALVARWAASLKKSAGASVYASPITGR